MDKLTDNGKNNLHPCVKIGFLSDLLKELDEEGKKQFIEKLGEIRFENWSETLRREYKIHYGINKRDRKSQYERSAKDILSRLEAFPEGEIVAVYEGPVTDHFTFIPFPIGMISALRRNKIFGDWNEITGNGTYSTYESDGTILGCCEITVDTSCPKEIKQGVSKTLINKAIETGEKTPIIVAKTRPHNVLKDMQKEGMNLHKIKQMALDRNSFLEYMSDYIKPIYKEGKLRQRNSV
ncbi:MAG: hypothetical protein QW286_01755 [Candidatus Aenigmatarchaeota archaeon]